MTAFQWTFAIATALVLAAILEFVGRWILGRTIANRALGPGTLRVARFVFFSAFFFYSLLRTMTPVLDAHVHPLAVLFGMFALWTLVGSTISRHTERRRR